MGWIFWLLLFLSQLAGVRWAGFSGCFCVAVKVRWMWLAGFSGCFCFSVKVGWVEVGWVFWLFLCCCQSEMDVVGRVFVLMGEFGRIFCLLLCCCQKLTVSGQEQDG